MIDNKNIIFILLLLTLLFALLTIVVVADGGIPTISARSSILYEPTTKTFVYEKNADERLPMASTTKIMTALIAIEQCDLDKTVIIPKEATGIEGSSIYLKENDQICIRDLVYSVLLQSANDAATALAIEIGGDIRNFANIMNERAKEIGLSNTSFENPHGLDSSEHFTTARDLAILSAEALKNSVFREICSTYKYSFCISDSPRTIVNHNKMLKLFDGATGVKTGYTDKSGRCLVSSAKRDGIELISVTLNAPDDWNDHKKLLNYGFDKFEAVLLSDITETSFTIAVSNGTKPYVSASVNNEKIIPRDKSAGELNTKIDIPDILCAPIYKGDKIGSITVYKNDDVIMEYDLTADEHVNIFNKKIDYFDFIKEHFQGVTMEKIRLQKFIADAGVMSRRSAEEEIKNGNISVNGHVATPGTKVDPKNDVITFRGKRIRFEKREYTYIMLNKPRGYLSSTSDDRGRKCVTDLLTEVDARVYPVGRLDLISEGMLLLTDDGELKNRLTHPSHQIPKVYRVKVAGSVSDEQMEILTSALVIDGYKIKPVAVTISGEDESGTVMKMTLFEGRNRQIRKMCEQAGLTVKRLARLSIGDLKLDGMPVGKWRYLSKEEVDYLYKATKV